MGNAERRRPERSGRVSAAWRSGGQAKVQEAAENPGCATAEGIDAEKVAWGGCGSRLRQRRGHGAAEAVSLLRPQSSSSSSSRSRNQDSLEMDTKHSYIRSEERRRPQAPCASLHRADSTPWHDQGRSLLWAGSPRRNTCHAVQLCRSLLPAPGSSELGGTQMPVPAGDCHHCRSIKSARPSCKAWPDVQHSQQSNKVRTGPKMRALDCLTTLRRVVARLVIPTSLSSTINNHASHALGKAAKPSPSLAQLLHFAHAFDWTQHLSLSTENLREVPNSLGTPLLAHPYPPLTQWICLLAARYGPWRLLLATCPSTSNLKHEDQHTALCKLACIPSTSADLVIVQPNSSTPALSSVRAGHNSVLEESFASALRILPPSSSQGSTKNAPGCKSMESRKLLAGLDMSSGTYPHAFHYSARRCYARLEVPTTCCFVKHPRRTLC